MELPKMKTIKEISKLSGLSYYYIRNLCLNNQIVYVRAGNKFLINYDRFAEFLNGTAVKSQ